MTLGEVFAPQIPHFSQQSFPTPWGTSQENSRGCGQPKTCKLLWVANWGLCMHIYSTGINMEYWASAFTVQELIWSTEHLYIQYRN